MSKALKTWETYEEVATYLLNEIARELGVERFEGKQKVIGRKSGIEWEIDAKGVCEDDELFFIVECRRYVTSRQNQEKLSSLAYRIIDTGAKGGIVVSPLGLQAGAAQLAQAENIYNVILDENSTCAEYVLRFLERVRVGKRMEATVTPMGSLSLKVTRADGSVEELGEV